MLRINFSIWEFAPYQAGDAPAETLAGRSETAQRDLKPARSLMLSTAADVLGEAGNPTGVWYEVLESPY
ncbi:hypothetical protein PVT71_24820 (plasmid) [Salipiger sp. H15]|uniref:Uncharacterized protein n=1 Tax=Alloyangia sp. H15 TaxID=3029062 RepID=A0AAU8ARV3_9RHOB